MKLIIYSYTENTQEMPLKKGNAYRIRAIYISCHLVATLLRVYAKNHIYGFVCANFRAKTVIF